MIFNKRILSFIFSDRIKMSRNRRQNKEDEKDDDTEIESDTVRLKPTFFVPTHPILFLGKK